MKHLRKFENFSKEEEDFEDEDGHEVDEDIETIEGEIEYDGSLFTYKVDIIDNLGFIDYRFDYIESDEVDEEYIEENWDSIKVAIIRDLKNTTHEKGYSSQSPKYIWIATDTRTGRILGEYDWKPTRDHVAEMMDVPALYVEIRQK